jgi:hypothetical protein
MGDEEILNDEAELQPTIAKPDVVTSGRVALQAQIEALQKSLDQRMQMPFNPTMMALAAGFLKPTQTGGFGESLGYAAEGAAGAAEKERSRRSEVEKMKLELALKQYEMNQDAAGRQMLGQVLGGVGQPKGTGPVAGATTGAPSGGTPTGAPVTQDVSPQEAVDIVKNNPSRLSMITITPEIITAVSAVSPKWGAVTQKLYENQTKLAGVQQKEEELGLRRREVGTKGIKVTSPYDADREMNMTSDKYEEYLKLDFSDNKAVNSWLRKNGLAAFAIGKETAPVENAPSGEVPAGLTKKEQEIETERQKTTETERAKLMVKDEESIRASKLGARPIINAADDIISIVSSNPRYFDLLNSTEMKDAIARTVSKGITAPGGGSIRIDMKDIMAAAEKLPPEDRTAGMLAAQKMLQIQLSFARSFLKGEGQITEGERAIVAQATVDGLDNATAMRLKAEALKMKAEQDERVFDAFDDFLENNKGASFNKFLRSPQYKSVVDAYEKKLARVRDANAKLLGGGKAPKSPTATPTATPQKGGSLYQRIKEESQGQEGQE